MMPPANTSNVAPYYLFCNDRQCSVAFWVFENLDRWAVFVLPETEWNDWVNVHDFVFRNQLFQAGYSSRGCWRKPSAGMIEALSESYYLLHPKDIVLVQKEDGSGCVIHAQPHRNSPISSKNPD